jgi:menaquinone-dependent protoporphyrinogen oxidase
VTHVCDVSCGKESEDERVVTAASKYGATGEVADAIAGVLRERGFDTAVIGPEDVSTIDEYDAVVLGSAVYAGHWLKPAKDLVHRLGDAFRSKPVWVFSSGPVGDPLKPEEDPVDVGDLIEATNPREHRVFAGKIERKQLSFPERAIVMALRVPEGDFRDWSEIEAWATSIADALSS